MLEPGRQARPPTSRRWPPKGRRSIRICSASDISVSWNLPMAAMFIPALSRPYCSAPYIFVTNVRHFWGGTQGVGARAAEFEAVTLRGQKQQELQPACLLGGRRAPDRFLQGVNGASTPMPKQRIPPKRFIQPRVVPVATGAGLDILDPKLSIWLCQAGPQGRGSERAGPRPCSSQSLGVPDGADSVLYESQPRAQPW